MCATIKNTEDAMSHYMVRWQYASSSVKALVEEPQDRSGVAKAHIEDFGGKLHRFYFPFGEYDGVSISEFPDATAAAACSMTATAGGAFTRFETTMLLTAAEAEAAMKRAHETKTEYNPPNVSHIDNLP